MQELHILVAVMGVKPRMGGGVGFIMGEDGNISLHSWQKGGNSLIL